MKTSPEPRHFSDIKVSQPQKKRLSWRSWLLGKDVVNLRPNLFKRRPAAVLGIIVLLAFLGFTFQRIFTRGEIANFAAATCLGTWQNPQNAQGTPETLEAEVVPFTQDNSAIFTDGTGEIFCGGFVPGDFETEGELTSAALTLVWEVGASSTLPSVSGPVTIPKEPASSTATSTEAEPGSAPEPEDPAAFRFFPLALAQEEIPSEEGQVEEPASAAQEAAQEAAPAEPAAASVESQPAAEPAETEEAGPVIIAPPLQADLAPASTTEGTATTTSSSTESIISPPTEVLLPAAPAPDDNFLKVSYSLDGQSWYELQKVNVNNWPSLTLPLPVAGWDELKRIQISIEGIPTVLSDLPDVKLDGMIIEAHYDVPPLFGNEAELNPEVPDGVVDLQSVTSTKRDFKADEAPSFDIDLDSLGGSTAASSSASSSIPEEPTSESQAAGRKRGFLAKLFSRAHAQEEQRIEENWPAGIPTPDEPVVAQVLDPDGRPTELKPVFLRVGKQIRISIPEPKIRLKPGKYRVISWILKEGQVYRVENEFTWGVLAVNFNKSIYTQGDDVLMGMGVVDEGGHTVCDAQISVDIQSPDGILSRFSTAAGTISRSPECGPITVTNVPDYSVRLQTRSAGLYSAHIRLQTTEGEKEFTDKFEAHAEPEFDVERLGPVRIYPPEAYEMRFRIKANKHFRGSALETVPGDFEITDAGGSAVSFGNGTKFLQWAIDLAPGEFKEFSYRFDAPDISPEFYKLGPLGLGHWHEARQWQIAADAVSNNGRLYYGDATNLGVLKFQILTNPFSFGGEVSTAISATASHIAHTVARASPTRDEMMIGHLKVDGRLDLIRGVNGSDLAGDYSAAWNNPGTTGAQTCNSATEADCTRAFDVVYEQLSGRAVVFYADTTNQKLYYCVWNGTAWSPVSNCAPTNGTNDITLSSNGRPIFVTAKSKPRANEILVGVAVDVGGTMEAEAFVWDGNGTSTSNFVVLTDTTNGSAGGLDHGNVVDVEWESQSGDAVAVYATADTNQEIKYKRLTGGSWGSEQGAIDTNVNGAVIHTLNSDGDGRSDRVAVVMNGGSGDINAMTWKAAGTASWTNHTSEINETSLEGAGSDVGLYFVDVVWQTSTSSPTSTALVGALNAANNAVDFEYSLINCNDATGCAATTIDTSPATAGADDGTSIRLAASPNSADVMALWTMIDRDLFAQRWSGSAWQGSASAVLEGTISPGTADNTPMHGLSAAFVYIPYRPWTMNWRWTEDFTNNTPSAWLAAENATATDVGTGDTLRLRFNVSERAGMGQTDSRKRLQWTTSTNPDALSTIWTDVDGQGGSGIWRFANGPGTDDAVVSAVQLTSSTIAGPFVENGTSSSVFDHAALSVAEYDFALQNNGASVSTTYYFRMFDADQNSGIRRFQPSGLTPCANLSTCRYPSLTTSAGSPPSVSSVIVNNGNAIVLIPNSTTTVNVNISVSDNDGCSDVFSSGGATTTLFRSGATSACTANTLNCYISTAVTTHNCSGGTSANATTTFYVYYFADATDASSTYSSNTWQANVSVRDGGGATSTLTSSGVDLNTLLAIETATSSLSYGSVSPGSNTSSTNQKLRILNAGNASSSLQISGTALVSGSNAIPTSSQHYATSSFTFGGLERLLSDIAAAVTGFAIQGIPLSAWTTDTPTASGPDVYCPMGHQNHFYRIGGRDGSNPTSTNFYASILGSGALGSWAETTPLPDAVMGASCVGHNGYVYRLGGQQTGGSATSSVVFAPVNSNGTLGSWATTTALTTTGFDFGVGAYGGYVYVIGGSRTSATSGVMFAAQNANGTLGTWTSTTPLPTAMGSIDQTTIFLDDFIYVLGNSATTTVFYARVNSTGSISQWNTGTSVPELVNAGFSGGDYGAVFLAGGSVGGSGTSSVNFAPRNPDGSLGPWSRANAGPVAGTAHGTGYEGMLYWISSGGFEARMGSRNLYWGAEVPAGRATGTYSGTVTYTAVFSP